MLGHDSQKGLKKLASNSCSRYEYVFVRKQLWKINLGVPRVLSLG